MYTYIRMSENSLVIYNTEVIVLKLEMLQEYIVEDLHGCYTPPKLDPEHEERLKMLKLL